MPPPPSQPHSKRQHGYQGQQPQYQQHNTATERGGSSSSSLDSVLLLWAVQYILQFTHAAAIESYAWSPFYAPNSHFRSSAGSLNHDNLALLLLVLLLGHTCFGILFERRWIRDIMLKSVYIEGCMLRVLYHACSRSFSHYPKVVQSVP